MKNRKFYALRAELAEIDARLKDMEKLLSLRDRLRSFIASLDSLIRESEAVTSQTIPEPSQESQPSPNRPDLPDQS